MLYPATAGILAAGAVVLAVLAGAGLAMYGVRELNAQWAGVLVTALGVGVAAWYAWLTRRLWQATRVQTELTRDIFQSEQRPYVAIRFDAPRVMDAQDIRTAIEYRVYLRNGGRSPAIIAALIVEATHDGQRLGQLDLGTAGLYLFPGEEQMINEPLHVTGDAVHRHACDNPVVVTARVDYVGPSAFKGTHATAVEFHIRRSGTFITHQVTT